ncbi:MAG: hypothetical protein JY451_14885 [Erythrobacter sp.]|nr:MAG: hypothetical protein JY451_14885 [Erythrobacter sp.]
MEGNPIANRVAQALARIDAAAGRIEAAAASPRAAALSSLAAGGPGSDPELEARYAALQREAGEALQQLDLLLGTLER